MSSFARLSLACVAPASHASFPLHAFPLDVPQVMRRRGGIYGWGGFGGLMGGGWGGFGGLMRGGWGSDSGLWRLVTVAPLGKVACPLASPAALSFHLLTVLLQRHS